MATKGEVATLTGRFEAVGGGHADPLSLPFEKPFHAGAILAALATHAIPGVERSALDTGSHSRAVRTPSGPTIVTVQFHEDHLAVTSDPLVEDRAWLASRVRRWLDLDSDPVAIADAFSGDPVIGPLVAARPGLRVLGYVDSFEGAIMTVIGQQVSLAATRTFGGRLVASFGTAVDGGPSVFPAADSLAALAPAEVQRAVGLTGARARTVVGLAKAVADGLQLNPEADLKATRTALLALPGIGPWTVDYLSVRALRDPDAFVPGDLVLRRALAVKTAKEAEVLAESWRPYRAYALYHLWTQAAYL